MDNVIALALHVASRRYLPGVALTCTSGQSATMRCSQAEHCNNGMNALQVKLIHINNTGPDLLPLKTSKITLDWTYRALNKTEKLAIWEDGVCLDSLRRPMDENDTSISPDTVHHYCEEFWFKTNVDIVLNMTAVIPVIDDLLENYFPSLPGDSQGIPAHIRGHVGVTKKNPSGGVLSGEKESAHGQSTSHHTHMSHGVSDGAIHRKSALSFNSL